MPSSHFSSDSEVTSVPGLELDGIRKLQFQPGLHCSSGPFPVNHLLAPVHLCLIPAQEGDTMMATWKLNSTWRCRETP